MAQPAQIVKIQVPQSAAPRVYESASRETRSLFTFHLTWQAPISAEGFRVEIRLLKEQHNQPDFEERLARTRKTITSLDRFVPEGDVNAFLERQSRSNVVVDFLLDHPDQQEEMIRLSRFQYNLEHTLASLQPK